jgi:peptidoglycan/LPS O-acetylase OafA/YrhL
MKAGPQIDSLTSLRGIAAWWVVLYHVREWPPLPLAGPAASLLENGYLAVDFFFVLSGFVIGLNYSAVTQQPSIRNYASFLSRRLARIYPLHIVVLGAFLLNPLAIILFSSAKDPGTRYDAMYYLASVFLVQNWGFTRGLAWNIPAWSISTELAAYLVFPLIGVAISRICSTKTACLLLGILISLLLAATFREASLPTLGDGIPTHGLVRCVASFTLGTIAARYFASYTSVLRRQRAGLLAIALLTFASGTYLNVPNYWFVPGCFTLLVLYFASRDEDSPALIKSKCLVYVGEISYSTYLVHYLIKDWVKFASPGPGGPELAAYLGLVLLFSVLLYRYVETPGRTWLRRVLPFKRHRESRAPA